MGQCKGLIRLWIVVPAGAIRIRVGTAWFGIVVTTGSIGILLSERTSRCCWRSCSCRCTPCRGCSWACCGSSTSGCRSCGSRSSSSRGRRWQVFLGRCRPASCGCGHSLRNGETLVRLLVVVSTRSIGILLSQRTSRCRWRSRCSRCASSCGRCGARGSRGASSSRRRWSRGRLWWQVFLRRRGSTRSSSGAGCGRYSLR